MSNPSPLPSTVGRYRLLGKLAAGGMAEVFLAEVAGPAGFQKTVVLKRIHPHLACDPAFVEMFQHEARLAAMLAHPNIVQILELGEDDGTYFIAMEHVDGADLCSLAESASAKGAQLPWPHVARAIALACEGLAFAHDFAQDGVALQLVHRDISPDNLMVSRAGAVKVMDFGVAKARTQRHRTQTGTLKGKLAYMAPEHLRGEELDRRVDVFALGATLYEVLAGVSPFDCANEGAVVESILHGTPIPLDRHRPDCPAALVDVVDRALQKDPERRYPDCRAMLRDLEEVLRGAPPVGAFELGRLVAQFAPPARASAPTTLAMDTAPMRAAPAAGKSRRALAVAGALVAGLALMGIGAFLARSSAAPEPVPSPPEPTPLAVRPPPEAPVTLAALDPGDAGADALAAKAEEPRHKPAKPSKPAAHTQLPPKMVEIPLANADAPHAGAEAEAEAPKGSRIEERFRAADHDGDGRLSRSEFEGLGLLKRKFSRFDADGDGFVSLEEAKKEMARILTRHSND